MRLERQGDHAISCFVAIVTALLVSACTPSYRHWRADLVSIFDHPKAKPDRWNEAQIRGEAIDELKFEVTWPKGAPLTWSDAESGKLESS